MTDALSLVVLVSGRGSNLRALLEAVDGGRCAARVTGVIADRECAALELAAARGLRTGRVQPRAFDSKADWDRALADAIGAMEPDLVVLAGFMRIVREAVLTRFGGRIVNVHPSLLPAFPGLDAPTQAVEAGARISGCTVHVVDAGVDTGPILAQAALPVLPGDDGPALHARIQPLEHELLPSVIHWIATGAIELTDPPRLADPTLARAQDPLFSPPIAGR